MTGNVSAGRSVRKLSSRIGRRRTPSPVPPATAVNAPVAGRTPDGKAPMVAFPRGGRPAVPEVPASTGKFNELSYKITDKL